MSHPSRRTTLALLPALSWPAQTRADTSRAPLTLVTSELPPMAMAGEPGRRGVLLDLVELMLARTGLSVQPQFYPFARAVLLATEQPRTLITPLNRTPEREARFHWLVKLYTQRVGFHSLSSQARVETLEQARRLRIAALRGSSTLDTLQRQGVQPGRIYQSASVSDMHRALEHRLVDAIYGSELIHFDAWRRGGRSPAQLQTGLVLESLEVWLAGHRGSTAAEQEPLQRAHAALLADGSIERLFKHYGLTFRAEDAR